MAYSVWRIVDAAVHGGAPGLFTKSVDYRRWTWLMHGESGADLHSVGTGSRY